MNTATIIINVDKTPRVLRWSVAKFERNRAEKLKAFRRIADPSGSSYDDPYAFATMIWSGLDSISRLHVSVEILRGSLDLPTMTRIQEQLRPLFGPVGRTT